MFPRIALETHPEKSAVIPSEILVLLLPVTPEIPVGVYAEIPSRLPSDIPPEIYPIFPLR